MIAAYDNNGDVTILIAAERLLRTLPPTVDNHISLSVVLMRRGRADGDVGFINDALVEARSAVALAPHGDPLWAVAQSQVAWVLSTRFEMERREAEFALANPTLSNWIAWATSSASVPTTVIGILSSTFS